MSAGRRYEALCQVVGARPPPAVTWWKGTAQIRDNITTTVSQAANYIIHLWLLFDSSINVEGVTKVH